jgi:hypothetical protein
MWSAGLNQLRGAKAAERTRKEAELRMIESRLRRIVDAIADGVTALTLKDELLALETRKVALEPELAGWRDEPVRLHSEYGRRYHKQVEELAALVQSEEDKQDSRLFAGWLTGSFSRLNGANSESTCMGRSRPS